MKRLILAVCLLFIVSSVWSKSDYCFWVSKECPMNYILDLNSPGEYTNWTFKLSDGTEITKTDKEMLEIIKGLLEPSKQDNLKSLCDELRKLNERYNIRGELLVNGKPIGYQLSIDYKFNVLLEKYCKYD